MVKEWLPKLYADKSVESIPATEEGIIELVLKRSDYKSRKQRES